ncbi:unnamed protein product [Lactuca saligna]|uniref:Uncharacterized protein n=1 Tax=Lactuca saligna TaxID=75948 RepID=A0AA35Z939_LACSI|nr:unnamed protein product [Lactuca saligna]
MQHIWSFPTSILTITYPNHWSTSSPTGFASRMVTNALALPFSTCSTLSPSWPLSIEHHVHRKVIVGLGHALHAIIAIGYGGMLTCVELSRRTFQHVNTAPWARSRGVEWTALWVITTNWICFFQMVIKMVVVLDGSCQKSSMCLPEKEIAV